MMDALLTQVQQQSPLEVIAVVFAILYVVFAARQNILCWPSALISTGIYVYIFWEVMLPFQSLLNLFYLIIAVYGWFHWRKIDEDGTDGVSRWPIKKHLIWWVIMAVLAAICITAMESWIVSEYLVLDGVIAIYSCLATYLMAKKVLENWLYWIIINTGAVYLYFAQGLYLTTLLFSFYCVYAVVGWCKWRQSYQAWQNSAELQKS